MGIFAREPEYTASYIQNWVREKIVKSGSNGAILGLSGGIDSSVLAVLLRRELGAKMLALVIPCHSDPNDLIHAKLLSDKFDIPNHIIDITKIYDDFIEVVSKSREISKLARANTKSRLRMTTLYTIGQSVNYLVCGTSNKSEFTIGYFTKHGDSGCDLLPLADLLKYEIYKLAEYLDIPKEIISKPPSGGLWEGQTDEGEIGLPYSVIDSYISAREASGADANKIDLMHSSSAHKRETPPICKIV